jgi:molecular chaperone Hsp33
MSGELRRFLLEAHPVRGHHVQLRDAWQQLRSVQEYPPVIETLLGEAATAAVLLAATLKFEGKLTLQLSGNGLVRLLVAQCTHDFRIRAVAHYNEQLPVTSSFVELVGNGRMVVSIESSERNTRYQGIVALAGNNLSECLENYFTSSEQLPTRLVLVSSSAAAAGLLIQKLPTASGGEASGAAVQNVWEELQQNLPLLSGASLLAEDIDVLLPRVCGAHDCRLFGATPVTFECSCSQQRVGEVLRSVGEAEARSVLAEQGSVTVTCEFCRRPYRFDAVDVEQLFAANTVADNTQRLN